MELKLTWKQLSWGLDPIALEDAMQTDRREKILLIYKTYEPQLLWPTQQDTPKGSIMALMTWE